MMIARPAAGVPTYYSAAPRPQPLLRNGGVSRVLNFLSGCQWMIDTCRTSLVFPFTFPHFLR